MSFILNPNSLNFNPNIKKPQGYQYYQWRYKQKIQNQQQQLKKIGKYLQHVEQQEQQQYKQNISKKRIHHHGTFYEYNLQWKKKIQNKIDQQKHIKEMESIKEQESCMKNTEVYEDKKQVESGYKGPVQGWQQHFQNYLKNKNYGLTTMPEQVTFQPKINQRSRKMTQGITGKVQDRLIMFGEFSKIKNQQQINRNNIQLNNYSFSNSNVQVANRYSSKNSDIFYRLYKDGEQTTKKKKQMAENDDRCTFQPKINKLPETVQDKIMKSRKPLYYIKNQSNTQTQQTQLKKQKSKGDFQGFMKRNQALLQLKKKMMTTLVQQTQQKQNIQKSQCTFTPILNKNSKRITKTIKQQNRKFQQKMKNNIKQNILSQQNQQQCLQNIDISKLTVPECKDSLCDQSDSLSIYRMDYQQKQSNKSYKKQHDAQTYITTARNNKKDHKQQSRSQNLYIQASNSNIISNSNSNIHSSNIDNSNIQNNKINNSSNSNISMNMNINVSKSKNIQINQQDSLERGSYQWQSELNQIQNHIQSMMSRATK